MALNAIGSTSVDELRQRIMGTFDRNADGQLSAGEFSDLLQKLVTDQKWVNIGKNTQPGAAGTAAAAAEGPGRFTVASGEPPATLEGFNPEKMVSGQSVKYRFARVAQQYSLSSVQDKPAAETLLREMKPALEREGLEVVDIKNDRIQIKFEGRDIWVDVIRAAGAGAKAFQWMPEA